MVPVNLNASDFWTSAIEKKRKEKKRNMNRKSMDIANDETLTKNEFKKDNNNNQGVNQKENKKKTKTKQPC